MSNPNWKNGGRGNTNDKLEDMDLGDDCLTLEQYRRLELLNPKRGERPQSQR